MTVYQVRYRRETATWLSANAGVAQELIVNTTTNRLHVMDGVTLGGFPLAKLSEAGGGSGSVIAISGGGTGSTTAADARTALSAAKSGANSDITSLGGLTTSITIAQGGTGAATATDARTALSAAQSGANSDITSLGGLTTSITIAQGGTGATTSTAARSALFAAKLGINSDITSLTGLTTPLSAAQGGTGANSAGAARTALGAAASGANSDITSFTGLTTSITIAQGGTGANSAGAARTALGAAASGANSDITSLTGLTTPLSVAQGGTGSSNAAAARTALGIVQNNYTATGYPASTNDTSQGYSAGSRWLVAGTGEMFTCRDATTNAAVWVRNDLADYFGAVAGRNYTQFGVVQAIAGSVFPATTMRLYPIIVKSRVTINQLALRVTTLSAGGSALVAVYAADPATKYAIGTPLFTSGTLSTNAVGTPFSTLVTGTGVLEAGMYWVATMVDNTTAVFTSLTNTGPFALAVVGTTTLNNAILVNANLNFSTPYTTFGTWPDLTGVSLTEATTGTAQTPHVVMRVGSAP